ncbi:MAG: hypothetical protein IPM13_15935 [Phycisphaerales bacterium]|nr:hypothetical protein [Phycisphaerales bacterium]
MKQPWFWWLLTLACLAWYATVTVYVAIRGARDIRVMLARLAQTRASESDSQARPPTSGSRG